LLLVVLLLAGAFSTYQFLWRSVGTFILLRSAYELGVPSTSTLRAWMTLDYISKAYQVPLDRLLAGIGAPEGTALDTPLFRIAAARGKPRIEIVRDAQTVIAAEGVAAHDGEVAAGESDESWLSAVLAYSYPALAAILLLGAVGAPVPTGFATVLAGALAADGGMAWPLATAIAVSASVCGDLVGYGVGRFAGKSFVDRYGRYLGYAGERKARIETLFARWGGVTVFLTRTLVSHMSSVASVLAGLSRYAFLGFIVFAVAGRVVWTAAYFGAGYWVGTDLEASSSFLESVTGLVISLGVVAISTYYLLRGWRRPTVAVTE
jgi:membrane protein DedA with SNARE-associated domain